jgi:molybdopterin synthase sulfur carrier subunit
MTVLAFGVVAEIIGKNRFAVEGIASTALLKQKLEQEFPGLKTINVAIAVNKKIVSETTSLHEDATVALLPPFSGG